MVARKPNGKIRMCVDLRDVNSKIVVETHPLPNINEMLMTLDESDIYTTLDLSSAYHKINLTDESKDITAFIIPDGLYRYTIVPYGLASCIFTISAYGAHDLQGRQRCLLLSR